MFFGETVAAFANEKCFTNEQPDPIKFDPIILIIMMGFSYCNLKKVIG